MKRGPTAFNLKSTKQKLAAMSQAGEMLWQLKMCQRMCAAYATDVRLRGGERRDMRTLLECITNTIEKCEE